MVGRGRSRHCDADVDAQPHRRRGRSQALIAAQFATVLQVVRRSIWHFLDAILLAAWWLGIGWLLRQDHLHLSRLSLVHAAAAAAGTAAANVARLSVVRDVLLGVLFMLWTACWISLLVVFARQTQTASTTELPDEPETNVLRP